MQKKIAAGALCILLNLLLLLIRVLLFCTGTNRENWVNALGVCRVGSPLVWFVYTNAMKLTFAEENKLKRESSTLASYQK